MAETWEQTKIRLKNQGINLKSDVVVIPPPTPPVEHNRRKDDRPVKLYNVHKRSLPPGIDKIVVFGVTKEEAEWWVEHKLKTRCYENGPDDSKTVIFYDVIPVDATPRERSIYYNAGPITMEPVPGFTSPRRIN